MLSIEELIARKRDGGTHTAEELERLVSGFVVGDVPDYQMAAWLMAAFIRGLDAEETVWLTDAMARSGECVDLGPVGRPVIDKHSTGGVGDSLTLVVAPLVAACGVPVGKMSGRGLGHTGGTLDKLEAIPGFRTELTVDEFVAQVARVGVAVVAQTPEIDPADKAVYALRDVTATVPSVPLIVASIVSKKVAGGASAVLLDVKVGSGAFMKTTDEARVLARELQRVASALGLDARCVLTGMDEPVGPAVGNALEVAEAAAALAGEDRGRLAEESVALAGRMLVMGGVAGDVAGGEAQARGALLDGRAIESFRRWVAAQGGDPRLADEPLAVLPTARCVRQVFPPLQGYLSGMDAEGVGRAAVAMGAGRAVKEAAIDPAAGIVLGARIGDEVSPGEPVAELHAASESRLDEGEARLLASLRFSEEPPEVCTLFEDV